MESKGALKAIKKVHKVPLKSFSPEFDDVEWKTDLTRVFDLHSLGGDEVGRGGGGSSSPPAAGTTLTLELLTPSTGGLLSSDS